MISHTPAPGAASILGALAQSAGGRRAWLLKAAAIGLGIALITAAAKIQVPFWPVPTTMQTLAVLLIGASYGRLLSLATVAGYLGLGAAGLPVFAGATAGLGILVAPTAGYLIGFFAATLLLGWACERGIGRSLPRLLALCLAASAVILLLGTAFLSLWVGPAKALALGLLPFLFGDALKSVLAAILVSLAQTAVRRSGTHR
ncbi:MAG: biotin transporter BioY [Alphaproteobacteria bacterium]